MKYLKKVLFLLPLMASAVLFQNCKEDIDTSSRYVFDGSTVMSYLEDNSDIFSKYIELLKIVKVSNRSESTVYQLLTARGQYTCFAPTNEAIDNYLVLLKDSGVISLPSWDAPEFSDANVLYDTQKSIVLNSIINNGDETEAYTTNDFSKQADSKGLLGIANMLDNKLQVTKSDSTKWYCIEGADLDKTAYDRYTINGRVHEVHKVIAPSTESASGKFKKVIEKHRRGIYVYSVLFEACNLLDTLSKTEDMTYYIKKQSGILNNIEKHNTEGVPGYLPDRRYIGFTIFNEGDEWWEKKLGVQEGTIQDMDKSELIALVKKYVEDNKLYIQDGASLGNDYATNENNALRQFVTYHILPEKIQQEKLVIPFNALGSTTKDHDAFNVALYDYYTSFGKRRLLKTYKSPTPINGGNNVWLNRVPTLDNGRHGTYQEAGSPTAAGVEIKNSEKIFNAYIYTIEPSDDRGLCYDEITQNALATERIRIDVSSMFKELMTNDIRANDNLTTEDEHRGFPIDNNYRYLEDCWIGENSKFYYFTGRWGSTDSPQSSSWHNYQGDELNVIGKYEMTMKLPPVPKDGIYELRFGASCSQQRGMCQVYWGTNRNALPAAGIPLDLRKGGRLWYMSGTTLFSYLGWDEDGDDDDVNIEMDKKLRNNMIMKAPNSYHRLNQTITMREEDNASKTNGELNNDGSYSIIRRIIIREEMKANQTYYIQFRNVLENPENQFYMDYIEYCPKEIYDNPTKPEDIW